MKHNYLPILLMSFVLMFTACKKSENQMSETTQNAETGLEQDQRILENEKGDKVTIVYYAEGNTAAVKLTKNSDPEQKLIGKAVSQQGNPIFANEEMMWEMDEGGLSGTLTDKAGNKDKYRAPQTEE